MRKLKLITERDLNGEHPLFCEFKEDFVFLNMWTDGIWCIDSQHPGFKKAVETALLIAKKINSAKDIEFLTNILENLRNKGGA